MKTYNFIVFLGKVQMIIDINAHNQNEAIKIVKQEYPSDMGWNYILI